MSMKLIFFDMLIGRVTKSLRKTAISCAQLLLVDGSEAGGSFTEHGELFHDTPALLDVRHR
ncbi:MAG: hypothetical protein ACRDBP_15730 [Luteolibacter sp.]